MKYLILVGDGMGDYPMEELGGKTLLQAAKTPNMDLLAGQGMLGLAQTVPQGMAPGSDVANMSLMGYAPKLYHTGRSPIEAAAVGIELGPNDVSFRCNLVTLAHEDNKTVMADYASGHIDDPSAAEIIATLEKELGGDDIHFYTGQSYRHLVVWKNGPLNAVTAPPHDYSDQTVDHLLNEGGETLPLVEFTKKSWPLLEAHPVNKARSEKGEHQANSIWLWGQGTKPTLPKLKVTGFTVSAVNLVKGLGIMAGLEAFEVPGANGWLDTNYEGKVQATLDGLKDRDLGFLHVEAPDETGHGGILSEKIQAIELFDEKVVGPVMAGMKGLGHHRVLLATDHYTPVSTKTHSSEPVPFVIWDSEKIKNNPKGFNEVQAARSSQGKVIPGYELMKRLLG
ncbi:cofactor-independent phosphoglycerate mutase [Dethiosulfatarculus sandiegensis]|uniref:Phosphoglycerate mutase n=1 Tax=Dethiosulfatarculus sandiegensis TaxID=1429043 RepID=A0A0D2G9E3_9BACT|nr:cofactor-independent phosphoglycerate mutase [Dethiosulfatarculus sandiegensis]KIX11472.1 phosphoglycerate mutase [Dethiosulfatarculus sandiegensis]